MYLAAVEMQLLTWKQNLKYSVKMQILGNIQKIQVKQIFKIETNMKGCTI